MSTPHVDDARINTLRFVQACGFADGFEVWWSEWPAIDLHRPDTAGPLPLAAPRRQPGEAALPIEMKQLLAELARRRGHSALPALPAPPPTYAA